MNLQQFEDSLSGEAPPEGVTPILQALWYEGKGDWDRAHKIVQDIPGASAAWVHAYLHRGEGDTWNGDYWYSHAGRTRPSVSLKTEWQELVAELLGAQAE